MRSRIFQRQLSAYLWSVGLAFVLLSQPVDGVPHQGASAPPETVTLRVPSGELPKLAGVTLLERIDYGAFSIVEVSPQDAAALKAAKVRVMKEEAAGIVGLQGRAFSIREPQRLPDGARPGQPAAYIVSLAGPTKVEWLEAIERSGGKIVGYVPQNNYLVWIDPARVSKLDRYRFIKWKGIYRPDQKVAKGLQEAHDRMDYLSVVIYDQAAGGTIAQIKSLGAKFVREMEGSTAFGGRTITAIFSANASVIPKISELPRVLYLDRFSASPGLDDELSCQIVAGNRINGVPYPNPSYSSWLQQLGYNGSGSKIAVVDTGCDSNDNTTAHLDLRGRLDTIIRYYPGITPPKDVSGHGTHVAGVIAGSGAVGTVDDEGYLWGLGIAPDATLAILYAISPGAPFPPGGKWSTITKDAASSGAFVSNNSWWLSDIPGQGYTATCSAFDALVRDADPSTPGAQPLTMVFSAGNSGPSMSTILEPKEAKNIITVGASENYRPAVVVGPTCGTANNIDGIASFSSRGLCVDGRIAPTVVAPGSSIASARSKYTIDQSGCRKQIDNDYVWMSGTSQAAPMVSGALGLVGQWWRATHGGLNPSPAMCKAILVNGADDIAGGPDGRGGYVDHIPNGDQGWGRLNIAASVNPPDTFSLDQTQLFTSSGQSASFQVQVADPAKPLKITLVWSDAPGTSGAFAWANDLDLTVTSTSGTYLGNVFQNGWSTVGGNRDYRNNTECVYIREPSGTYTVTVTAANIAADGVPGNSANLDQDFALVIRNYGGDTTPPTPPAIATEPNYTTDLTRLGASWSSSDPESRIAKYEYAIGTLAGADDIAGWTDVGDSTSDVRNGLNLTPGSNYYFTVRATNGVGLASQASSGAVLAAVPVPDIPAAKAEPDNTAIALPARTVTAAFSGRFYIEEDDRRAGIGVLWDGPVTESSPVTVAGKISKDQQTDERFIQAVDVR
ncbi:MAG: S8 family serine peptidase [Armatimonadetes bacterium]|nr:S8 family serine peptidase [Armatimonadota bacterium]